MLLSCSPADEPAATEAPAGRAGQVSAAAPGEPAGQPVPGVSPTHVLFGQSAAFTGPARELGRNMRLGIEAAFQEVNSGGGIHGRRLELVSRDDAYEPEAAIANTFHLIEEHRVFALIGAVGTPTSRSATPVAAEAGVPYIAPFTGAEFLRDPKWDNILNLRASYYQETEEMVARLTEDLGVTRIAVLYQDDSFGRAGYRGVRLALDRRAMQPVSIGLYPRNTTAVKTALLDLRRGEPEAVIMIGAYQPVAALINWARHVGMDPTFLTVSFVGSNALAGELGAGGEGVYVTQVVPFPTDESLPVVGSYLRALAAYDPRRFPASCPSRGIWPAGWRSRVSPAAARRSRRDCFLGSFALTRRDRHRRLRAPLRRRRQPGLRRGVPDPDRPRTARYRPAATLHEG